MPESTRFQPNRPKSRFFKPRPASTSFQFVARKGFEEGPPARLRKARFAGRDSKPVRAAKTTATNALVGSLLPGLGFAIESFNKSKLKDKEKSDIKAAIRFNRAPRITPGARQAEMRHELLKRRKSLDTGVAADPFRLGDIGRDIVGRATGKKLGFRALPGGKKRRRAFVMGEQDTHELTSPRNIRALVDSSGRPRLNRLGVRP
jgi:hypothetical protein